MRGCWQLLVWVAVFCALTQAAGFLEVDEDVCLWNEGLECGECTADSYEDHCETVCNMTTTCSGHGRCVSSNLSSPCHCFPGWTGPSCSVCTRCMNATVFTLGFSQGSVESFNSTFQSAMLRAISELVNIKQTNIEITALANSVDEEYPLVIQLVIYSAGQEKGTEALSKRLQRADSSGDLAASLANGGVTTSARIEQEPAEVTYALPDPLDGNGLPDNVPHVDVALLIANETVETFGKAKQDALKEALGNMLGLDPADLEVELLVEPVLHGTTLVAVVRGFPTVSNASLTDVAKRVEELGENPLDEHDLPFDADLDGPPEVVWGLVTTIGLSAGDVEEFNLTNQETLIDSLAALLGLEASELE
eukprot:1780394-Rhodomonas_salina.2